MRLGLVQGQICEAVACKRCVKNKVEGIAQQGAVEPYPRLQPSRIKRHALTVPEVARRRLTARWSISFAGKAGTA
jgi:hypothetical protein